MKKVWMVTGASRGIGLALCRFLLDAGRSVVATARNPDDLHKKLRQNGERFLILPLDITEQTQVDEAVDKAISHFGNIDVLVNNAGYGQMGWFENISAAQIEQQFRTNVFGSMNVTRAVLPHLRAQGSGQIFTLSDVAGLSARAGNSVYAASKFALEGWMEGLAAELLPLNIHATLIEPGSFRTDFLDDSSLVYGEHDIAAYQAAEAACKQWQQELNHQQVGDPNRLAAILMQLAEDEHPPVRFAAGSDAAEAVIKKANALNRNAQEWLSVSKLTDSAT